MRLIKTIQSLSSAWLLAGMVLIGPQSMANDYQASFKSCGGLEKKLAGQNSSAAELSIVKCSSLSSQYERILLTRLRDKNTSMPEFRDASQKIAALLVNKVVECLPIEFKDIATPLADMEGEALSAPIELVSIMRSGDALLDTFLAHFSNASVSKVLIQRDEETAEPQFKYMKLSPTLASDRPVVITEPMIATGGTLNMVISLLKEKGVKEDNIIIASICTAPEGVSFLNERYPRIQVVMTVMDQSLNDKMYIVPGLGDFGDRYFGTVH
ncbi:uracil phosphoribosyltransferase [Candidatus Protochlamydia phocaeensis]|uniref:uracil phosphoribosyltransferase n=1 Tax=Candidatus Protochlamydia phocaeensis TaxID=1414722 RepID=UPI00083979F3|nr:uracil phosphoribosyltransferase [Candidatus Protochlamydia phocaeensis]